MTKRFAGRYYFVKLVALPEIKIQQSPSLTKIDK